ncbi:hypothetical protein OE88DRAFT_1269674 [Heliocybe sulcata]|uniref:Uncharacterized protein n=1 Tax=Heliocybe sulcata TaxID=5364 RepID=A0A5C3N7J3_9AGAM|nr:hypothetical protein OE88DRAFT_1269674 [Heliocybe sulcata]
MYKQGRGGLLVGLFARLSSSSPPCSSRFEIPFALPAQALPSPMAPSSSSADPPGSKPVSNGKPSSTVQHLFKRKSTKKGKEPAPKGDAGLPAADASAGEQPSATAEQEAASSAGPAAEVSPSPEANSETAIQEGMSGTGDSDNPPQSVVQDAAGQDPSTNTSAGPQDQVSSSTPAPETVEPSTSSPALAAEANAQEQANEADKDKDKGAQSSTIAGSRNDRSCRSLFGCFYHVYPLRKCTTSRSRTFTLQPQ